MQPSVLVHPAQHVRQRKLGNLSTQSIAVTVGCPKVNPGKNARFDHFIG